MTAWGILGVAAVGLPFFVLALGYTSCSGGSCAGDCCSLPPPPPVETLPMPLRLRVEVTQPSDSHLKLDELRVRWYREQGPEGGVPLDPEEEYPERQPTADFTVDRSGRWTIRVEAPITDETLDSLDPARTQFEVFATLFDVEPGTTVDPPREILTPHPFSAPDGEIRPAFWWEVVRR